MGIGGGTKAPPYTPLTVDFVGRGFTPAAVAAIAGAAFLLLRKRKKKK